MATARTTPAAWPRAPNLLPGLQIPEAGRPVGGAGEDPAAVGRDGHALDEARVPLEAAEQPAALQIPDRRGRIAAGRHGAVAVRGDGQVVDAPRVPVEPAELLTRLQVPQPHGAVPAPAQGAAAVGQEGDGPDHAGVPRELAGGAWNSAAVSLDPVPRDRAAARVPARSRPRG